MVFCVNYILNHIYLRALKRFDMVHTIAPPFDILGLQIDIFEATKNLFCSSHISNKQQTIAQIS